MTNAILLLDIILVTVRARPFDGPVRGAAIDNDDLIDPGSIDLRHDCAVVQNADDVGRKADAQISREFCRELNSTPRIRCLVETE